MDRKFVIIALCYALLGMVLGIYMAASKDHGQFVTHAHIMLVGFVVSFSYALCHRLWLGNPSGRLAQVQFYLHQLGAAVMTAGLYLLYGQLLPPERVDPFLAASSLAVLLAMGIMLAQFVRRPSVQP
ncbi:TonB-dependent receptor [Aeromonas sp. AE23HZ002T15]